MDHSKDYYAILGLMPDAEDVVITAAYRVLISRYHPDKWKGDPAAAHQKSVELNEAYAVLSDPEKRKQYDKTRTSKSATFDDSQDDEDVDDALSELEARWQVAVDVFPDLVDLRNKLAKTAHRLAFSYVILLLETKQFTKRQEIAERLEADFLSRYFGSNEKIIYFAKLLIKNGERKAVKYLNSLIDVLGNDVNSDIIINNVRAKFSFDTNEGNSAKEILNLVQYFNKNPIHQNAIPLLRALGYLVYESSEGIFGFSGTRYIVYGEDLSKPILNTKLEDELISFTRSKF